MISPLEFFAVYGFRTTFLASVIVGLVAGGFGSLLYLRKQALMSDVMGHSSLLGVVAAFVFASVLGARGESMAVLVVGAAVSSYLAVFLTHWLVKHTVMGPDAAMATILSLFYGGGMCALHVLNRSALPNKAGISGYIFGNAATTRAFDLYTVALFGLLITAVLVALWKEFKVLCCDPQSTDLYGFRTSLLDPILLSCITVAVVVGIKSVGLILMVAFAILPAAAMHQFARSFGHMVIGSALIGGSAGGIGAYLSIGFGKVPTGPVVVLLLSLVFAGALVFSPRRRTTVTFEELTRGEGALDAKELAR